MAKLKPNNVKFTRSVGTTRAEPTNPETGTPPTITLKNSIPSYGENDGTITLVDPAGQYLLEGPFIVNNTTDFYGTDGIKTSGKWCFFVQSTNNGVFLPNLWNQNTSARVLDQFWAWSNPGMSTSGVIYIVYFDIDAGTVTAKNASTLETVKTSTFATGLTVSPMVNAHRGTSSINCSGYVYFNNPGSYTIDSGYSLWTA